MPFAPEVLSLEQLRLVNGLGDLRNDAWESPHPDIHPDLTELAPTFSPAIEQVSENVYNARGFDPANTTFVEGDDGVIVIDAMTVVDTAEKAMLAFREICDKPVKALIYTHDHGDHVFGAAAFVDPADVASGDVPVIAHRDLVAEIGRLQSQNFAIMGARAMYHTGALLPEG
ncbi:MAG: MBL fold metallo-hydrolase, partial [Acidimicrobiales bacterium]